MKIFKSLDGWRKARRQVTGSVGFVPTMGALHAGHATLLERSIEENDLTVLSIYVNPTQFNDPKDLANYPDTLDDDLALARELGVDCVFMPTYEDLYSDGYRYQITESKLSSELCGGNRPGHFTGVLTVVMKLLNIVCPDRAYFGKKDYQQYRLVAEMCDTFFMDIEIVGCATVREKDGLAMSSRNKMLDEPGRKLAPQLYSELKREVSDEEIIRRLERKGFEVDYVVTKYGRRFGAVVVVCEGRRVRLIDNVPKVLVDDRDCESGVPRVLEPLAMQHETKRKIEEVA